MTIEIRDLAAVKVAGDLLDYLAKQRAELVQRVATDKATLTALKTATESAATTAQSHRTVAETKASQAAEALAQVATLQGEIEETIAGNIPDHEWIGTGLRLRSPNGNWGVTIDLKGDAGQTAYEIAVDEGFEGTVGQWLASLVGEKGDVPAHEWNGTELTFENPDGSPGDAVDLVGPAGPTFDVKGAYSGAVAYVVNDVVRDQGSSWVCILATTGNAPPTLPTVSNTYWELIAQKGNTGPSGEGSGDMTAATYDPNGVADDAFAMANMVEGADAKIMTAAERTKVGNAFIKGTDTSDALTEGSTKLLLTATERAKIGYFTISGAFDVDAAATKLGYISVSQPVDLDAIEARVNALDAAVILKGTWDASAGTFPGSGAAQAGESWIVSVAGTVDGTAFAINDRIIAVTDNASTSTFASNWFKADYTDQVLSVAGRTGAVTLTADDFTDGSTNKTFTGTEKTKLSGIATGATANSSDATLLARANHTGSQLAATISDFSTAADARVSAAIGATVQAYNAKLAAMAGLTGAANKGLYFTGANTMATFDLTATALTLLDDTSIGAMLTTLGVVGAAQFVLPGGGATERTTNGSAFYKSETATYDTMIVGQEFSASVEQACQWSMMMPKSVDESASLSGTIVWTTVAGSSGNCIWGIRAKATGNDDAIDSAWGTAVEVTDGYLSASDDHKIAFSGLVPAGSWAEGDTLWIEVYRKAADGSDTLNGTSILREVQLSVTTNAGNDA